MAKQETTALVKINPEDLDALDKIATEYSLQATSALGRMRQAIMMATGIRMLRDALTPAIMNEVMALQGSPLGFLTDKDKDGGYPQEMVRDVMVEGLLLGLRPVGNEINIIGKRCYMARAGATRLLREVPGLTDLRPQFGVPQMVKDGAVVKASATWKLNGVDDKIDREIPIRVNAGQGADAILGKATRKLYAAILQQVTGSDHADGEVDPLNNAHDVTPGAGASLADRMDAAKADAPPKKVTIDDQRNAAPEKPGERAELIDRIHDLREVLDDEDYQRGVSGYDVFGDKNLTIELLRSIKTSLENIAAKK